MQFKKIKVSQTTDQTNSSLFHYSFTTSSLEITTLHASINKEMLILFKTLSIFAVILSGTSYFEGFLLQARDAASQSSVSTVGTFTLTNPDMTQLLTCNKQQVHICTHAHKDTLYSSNDDIKKHT